MKTEQAIELTLEVDEYLNRVSNYLNTPWEKRDPLEYQKILKMKEKLNAKIKAAKGDENK